eukprot:8623370-Prorocentrum_lima.AAC.1
MEDRKVPVFKLPAYSPDFTPVEICFAVAKRTLCVRTRRLTESISPQSFHELWIDCLREATAGDL